MEIKFSGRYDRSMFYQAVRLANTPPRNQRRFLSFMLLFSVGALGLMLYRIFDTRDFGGNAILLLVSVLMLGGVGYVYLQPTLIARRLWSNPGTRRQLKGRITNHSIIYELENGRNEIQWERFRHARRKDDLVGLVRKDGLLVVFSRGFFSRDSDWRKFLKLVERKFSV